MSSLASTGSTLLQTAISHTAKGHEKFPHTMPPASVERIPEMAAGVFQGDARIQLEAATQFRKLLSIERNPPIDEVIAANVVPQFVQFLTRHDNPPLQFQAAWALTNMAGGTSDQTKVVIDHGGIPKFVGLLQSSNGDVREQAAWGLGNIAANSPSCRNQILQSGALSPLLAQLQPHSNISMLRNATWALTKFCCGKPRPPFDLVKPALPILAQLILQQDDEVLTNACWALSYLSDGPNDKIQAVIESGVCMRLVELLMHPSPAVQTPALRTVGNIVTGDDLQTQVIINCSALPCLVSLLASPKKGIRKEACWTISNITAGNSVQIRSVIDANLIPPLIDIMTKAEFDIKKEAAWAISNATSGGTPEQINFLVDQGCVRPLCELLEVRNAKIVTVALEGLENILKVGATMAESRSSGKNPHALTVERAQGLEKIDNLQNHENNDIYERAVKMLKKYFGAVDEESENWMSLMPTSPVDIARTHCRDVATTYLLSLPEHVMNACFKPSTSSMMKQFADDEAVCPETAVNMLDTVALLKLVMKTPNGARIINSRKADGTTLLLDAVKNGQKPTVEYLLSVDECDINARDEHGATPMYYAAQNGSAQIVEYLLSLKECDINACCNSGVSPLAESILQKHFDIAKYLLEKQADVKNTIQYLASLKDCAPHTLDAVLLEAATKGSHDVLEILLMAGADFTATNASNEDIFALATKSQSQFNRYVKSSPHGLATRPIFIALQHRQELHVYSDSMLLENPARLEKLAAIYAERSAHRDTIVQGLTDLEARQGRSYSPPETCLSADALATLQRSMETSRTKLEQLENIVLEAAQRICSTWTSISGWEKKRDVVMQSPGYKSDPIDTVSLALSKSSTGAVALLAVPMNVPAEDLQQKSNARIAYWQDAMKILYDCSICMETCIQAESTMPLFKNLKIHGVIPCTHLSTVCKYCLVRHSQHFLQDSEQVIPSGFPCVDHQCSNSIRLNVLERILSPPDVSKCKSLMLNAAIKADPTSTWCSNYANCKGIARKNADGVGECDQCDTLTCCVKKYCGHAHHPGQTCEDVRDKSTDDMRKKHGWQNCPKCQAIVEKIDGCDHMDCILCKCKFCYFCGKTPRCGQRCSKRDS